MTTSSLAEQLDAIDAADLIAALVRRGWIRKEVLVPKANEQVAMWRRTIQLESPGGGQ